MDIVFTVNSYVEEPSALFVVREKARTVASIWRALNRSSSWGEFRRAMPAADWQNITEHYDEIPADDANFSPSEVPGFDDGYFPGGWPAEDALDWFPKDLIEKYDGWTEVTPNGLNLHLPAESVEAIAEDLRALGHTVSKSEDDLPEFLSYVYRG